MNRIGEKWMAADLYERCPICDGKGRIKPIHESNKELPACPECEGVGFMLVGMTMGELEKLEAIAKTKAAVTANPPWIPVVGDRVRSKTHGAPGMIVRVFRGHPAGFKPDQVLVNVDFDHGGFAYNLDMSEFDPVPHNNER